MIVALTFKTDLGDPTRFKKSESVGTYYGMTPRQYSSGETVRQGGISRCGAREEDSSYRSSDDFINTHQNVELFKSLGAKADAKTWG